MLTTNTNPNPSTKAKPNANPNPSPRPIPNHSLKPWLTVELKNVLGLYVPTKLCGGERDEEQ